MRLTGVIHGRQIQLERETGLRDGSTVDVRIEPRERADTAGEEFDQLCGSWAADASIEAIFDEIDRARFTSAPRSIRF